MLEFSEINEDAANTYLVNRKEFCLTNYREVSLLTRNVLREHLSEWKNKGISDVDLVCGGPPCQGYSGIGHRRSFSLDKIEIPSNYLFKEMARIIRVVKPKVFLFENVKGLLTSRWTQHGGKGEVFRDVLNTFRSIPGFHVRWQLVSANNYGVPQNRPRVLVIGVRKDIVDATLPPPVFEGESGLIKETAISDGFLPAPNGAIPPDPVDLLGDLIDPLYLRKSALTTYVSDATNDIQKRLRTCSNGHVLEKGDPITEQHYSRHSERIQRKFKYMINHNGEIPPRYRTKKFAQRVLPLRWPSSGPNITTTSLPDDFVHFSQPRTLTVREWARLQTFPDWYEFRGPRTTGGRRRAGDPNQGIWERDVPRYTQVGNAVPVMLAKAVGDHIMKILAK